MLLVSGSGHSGMEAVIANLLEPGETIVVGNHGIWGERVIDMAERYGGAHLPRGWLWRLPAVAVWSEASKDGGR